MSDQQACPGCNEPIKGGWSAKPNKLLTEKESRFINFVFSKNLSGYCEKCGSDLLAEAKITLDRERTELANYIEQYISKVRILTTHVPYNWQYEALSIVTGQAVTGTGVVSEFKSDFTDFFGGQSGSFNKKIAEGERLCFAQLRAKAITLGANAVIGTDIDYGSVGDSKGMLMVCASGTAVKVLNADVLGDDASIVNRLAELSKRLIAVDDARRLVCLID